jgi:DNA-binding NtrC family response regulator
MTHIAGSRKQEGAAAAAGRVLLVDDQPERRRLVRRALIKAGYTVVEAWNGRVAVELAQQLLFDVVISDVRMPDMSGLELLEALQELDPDLPVVLTSGSIVGHDSPAAAQSAAFAFLIKPVPLETMCSTATRAVELRRDRTAARERAVPYASVERLRVPNRDGKDGDDDDI